MRTGRPRRALTDLAVPEPNTGCLIWLGARGAGGYGYLLRGGKKLLAHRVAYEEDRGPIPPRMTIDHRCRVRCCINAQHLDVVDSRTNTLRGYGPSADNYRKATCLRGHAYRWTSNHGAPRRWCPTCTRDHKIARKLGPDGWHPAGGVTRGGDDEAQ